GDVEITDYANFQDYTFAVGGTGASMVIKVVTRFDAGDEEIVFDNIRVNEGSGDTDPPEVLSAVAISATEVDVLFNEDVDQTTAETESNYTVDNGIGNPSVATRDVTNNALVHLTVSTLTSYLTYMLEVINVEDLNSNAIDADTAYFVYVEEIGDVIITEFMANPAAVFDENGEWFEIYNNTESPINLNGWILKDNNGADTLIGDSIIASHDYFVFCVNETLAVNGGVPTDYVHEYAYGTGLQLANTADYIVIVDNSGQMQDSVAYDAGWGVAAGASHELKDLAYDNNIDTAWCVAGNAWIGSAGDLGTPGDENDCTAGDVIPPTISNAAAVSATQVNVLFSEDVDQTTAETTTNYSIDNGIGTPSAAVRDAGNNALVHLTVSTLSTGITYTITINNVEDLAGNPILPNSQATFEFVSVNPNDLLITEIMPNPNAVFDQNGEWFEVYNTTGSSIDMNGFILRDNGGSHTISGTAVVASHAYFVFCCNETLATNGGVPTDYEYPYAYPAGLQFSNTADVVKICTPGDVIIDSVQYTSSWPYGAGWSMQLEDLAYDNDLMASWCASQVTWDGSTGDKGTPGEDNECGPPPTPIELTICQARTEDACADPYYLDSLIMVRGIVSMADTCQHIAYMQAGGCGIAVYGYAVSDTLLPPARQMRAGDSIQVTGYLTSYAGLAEIAYAFDYDVEAVLLDSDKVVPITDVACALISDAADAGDDSCTGEAYESMKIRVSPIEFVATGTFAGNTNYQAVCSNDDTIQVRIHVCSDFVGTTIPTGPYNVVGNVGQYDWSICQCQGYQVFPLEFTPADEPCVDPDSLTIVRSSTLENVILRWRPNAGQNCDCYKIYSSTDPMAVFPGAGWTEVACVCSTTMYEYAPPVSTTAKLFYRVTAVASCP
ncbi:lamin tail domain-containing protein, partial [bacterium]|nr:lamin tail domain-containing protein [bacterium]